jgi:hypothetical protein
MIGLAAAAFGYGFRHGFDWDHVAAITDICAGQRGRRRAALLALLYALGHGAVVVVVGSIAVVTGRLLPSSLDSIMGRIVGATLVLLGAAVLWSLIRDGRRFRLRSRWLLVFSGLYRGVHRLCDRGRRRVLVVDHEHDHDHGETDGHDHPHGDLVSHPVMAAAGTRAPIATLGEESTGARDSRRHSHHHRHTLLLKDDPYASYGPFAATGVGVLHGLGIETPTQILAFVVAAEATGTVASVSMLLAWVVGLVVANSVITLAAVTGVVDRDRSFAAYVALALAVAAFSLVLGAAHLLGVDLPLPG